jgi:hypothetical protein
MIRCASGAKLSSLLNNISSIMACLVDRTAPHSAIVVFV